MGNPRKGGLSRLGFYRIVSEVRLININDPLFQPFFLPSLAALLFFFFIHHFIFIYYFLFSSLLLLISLFFYFYLFSRRNAPGCGDAEGGQRVSVECDKKAQ